MCLHCSEFTGRTPHYSSIIDYLFSLHDTPLALFVIASLLAITKRNHTNSCVQKLSSSEVLQDILFMSVRWWCKTDELWDVLLKHAYICRERLSLHSGGVLQGSIRYSCLAEGGDVGTDRAPHPVSLWRVSMWSALILFSSYWQWYGHWEYFI